MPWSICRNEFFPHDRFEGAHSGATLLASNECPYGLLPAVAARLASTAQAAFRYPDMACGALIEALAAHHGVAAERIAVGAGSSEVSVKHLRFSPDLIQAFGEDIAR